MIIKRLIPLMVLLIFVVGCQKESSSQGSITKNQGKTFNPIPEKEEKTEKILISSYSFGAIVINGKGYGDIKIYNNEIKTWKPLQQHLLTKADLVEMVESQPDFVVIGTGYSGVLEVEPEALDFLKEKGIDFFLGKTTEAYLKYNQLVKGNKKVAAILHSTC